MKAFLDTSGFYALVSSSDECHKRARDTYERLVLEEVPLYTSSYVLLETTSLIHKRMRYAILKRFLDSVMEAFSIIWIGEKIHRDAWNFLQLRGGKDFSFVDSTTILVAREIDAHIVTFNATFGKEGLKTLP